MPLILAMQIHRLRLNITYPPCCLRLCICTRALREGSPIAQAPIFTIVLILAAQYAEFPFLINPQLSPTDAMATTSLDFKSYKYQWAREVARRTLEDDLAALKGRIQILDDKNKLALTGDESVAKLAVATEKLTGSGFIPPQQGKFKICIVGAGVAGLFTAMVFDWLNENPKLKALGLEIEYDIVEAAGKERLGGRLYTHHFSDKEHDYYDVGAMRFPNNKIMKRQVRAQP